jgi:hypothetical protein
MTKKIILFLLVSFLPVAFSQADACRDIRFEAKKLYQKKYRSNIVQNSPEEQELDEQIKILEHRKEWCMKMQEAFDDMRSNLEDKAYPYSNYQDKELRLNTLANLNTFVSAHLDEYPENASLVKYRLNIFALGIQQKQCPWGSGNGECANTISETKEILSKALELKLHAKNNGAEMIESDENMLASVRELCESNEHLNNWGTKSYIIDTLKIGQRTKSK